MIGLINGEVIYSKIDETLVLTASGVGYVVHYKKFLAPNSRVTLFISYVFKDSGPELYAHDTLEDKSLFELLLTVNGIGPKMAYTLLKNIEVADLFSAIIREDCSLLKKTPGVGNKIAAQIILDLKDKIKKIHKGQILEGAAMAMTTNATTPAIPIPTPTPTPTPTTLGTQIISEVLAACQELGFKEENIIPIISKISKSNVPMDSSEKLLDLVLKGLA